MRLIDADALKEDLTAFYQNEVTARQLIDRQPTVSQWHRVEDGLPEPFEMVIAYVDPWHIFAAYHNGHGAWKENDGFNVIGVRYWMPIEPPKEE